MIPTEWRKASYERRYAGLQDCKKNLKCFLTLIYAGNMPYEQTATSRKVAGSIHDDVIRNFNWHNPSGRTMALVSTQSLTEMNTRNISSRVQVDVLGLTNSPPSYASCIETWEPQTPGILRACPGLYSDCFAFYIFLLALQPFVVCILQPSSGL